MQRKWSSPSGGLLFLLGSWAFLGLFLTWGFTEPNLERVMSVVLRAGEPEAGALKDSEVELLRSTMRRHEGLAVALAGKDRVGWVEALDTAWCTLPRAHYVLHGDPGARRVFRVECRAHQRAYPLVISLRGEGFSKDLRFLADGWQLFELAPHELVEPIIAEVSVVASIPAAPGSHPFQYAISSEAPGSEQRSP